MKILNIGSINIDYVYEVDNFVKSGETIPSNNFKIFLGGKGLNQSVALAQAGSQIFHAGNINIKDDNIKNQDNKNNENLNDVCDECRKIDESVTHNLILTGFKICESCRISKTIFPI